MIKLRVNQINKRVVVKLLYTITRIAEVRYLHMGAATVRNNSAYFHSLKNVGE